MLKNKKILLTLLFTTTMFLLPTFTADAMLSEFDGIDGYVYSNGVGVSGITIHIYRVDTNTLEGYKYLHNGEPQWLGTDITDSTGYFHIAYLNTDYVQYRVEAITPVGILTSDPVYVFCHQTVRVNFNYCPPSPGTGTPGYWKNHPEAWPVEEITIGSITYSKENAIAFLLTSGSGDKTYTMFGALIAAKLNVLIGNPSGCVDDTISDADDWMTMYGPVGSGVTGNTYAWKVGEPLYLVLDDYNNGLLCAPARE